MADDVKSQKEQEPQEPGIEPSPDAPSEPDERTLDTADDGEGDIEAAWAEYRSQSEQAPEDGEGDDPEPEPDTPDAKLVSGEDDKEEPKEEPQAGPAEAVEPKEDTPAEDFYVGRYPTREAAEAGIKEANDTIRLIQQDRAEMRDAIGQLAQQVKLLQQPQQPTPQEGAQTPPAFVAEDALAKALEGVDPNALLEDPGGTLQKALGPVFAQTLKAAQDNFAATTKAEREMQRQADARRAEVKAIAERGDKYIADKYPALKEGAGKAIGEGIIARLLAPHVPDAQLAPEQRQARHDFLHDPQKFADGVANIAKPYLDGLKPKPPADPRESKPEILEGAAQLPPAKAEVKPPQRPAGYDWSNHNDYAATVRESEEMWG